MSQANGDPPSHSPCPRDPHPHGTPVPVPTCRRGLQQQQDGSEQQAGTHRSARPRCGVRRDGAIVPESATAEPAPSSPPARAAPTLLPPLLRPRPRWGTRRRSRPPLPTKDGGDVAQGPGELSPGVTRPPRARPAPVLVAPRLRCGQPGGICRSTHQPRADEAGTGGTQSAGGSLRAPSAREDPPPGEGCGCGKGKFSTTSLTWEREEKRGFTGFRREEKG